MISHNARGLNIPKWRSTLLRELKKGRPHFVFLQDTHFKTHHIQRPTNSYFTKAFHATNNDSKSKGVSILVSRKAPFELTEQPSDPGGEIYIPEGYIWGYVSDPGKCLL